MASLDPATFLRTIPPFDALAPDRFAEAAGALDIAYHPAGARLVRAGAEPLRHLFVIRKGAVRLERDGKTLQLLEEGELFGYTSLLSGEATLDVLVEDDLVAYRVPGEAFRRLLSDAGFARHFAVGIAERLKSSLTGRAPAAAVVDLSLEVRALVRRTPCWIDAEATAQDAARIMRDERVSSVLVRTEPPGIVTDRDLRNKVLADDLGPGTPVRRIATSPLLSVPAESPVYAAWRILLDAGVHHLPVVAGRTIVGVLTSGDLLEHTARGPVALLRRVERLGGREALPGYAGEVAEMVSALVAGGIDAVEIAGFVARLDDALTHRILRWAERDLGGAPAPYAWLVFGSEGRMEQTLLTDQDNALVYADEGAERRDWFQALAERTNADLEAAGFPPCLGGHMARNDHGTLSEWRRKLDACADEPRPHDAELYFDFRRVAGHLDVSLLEAPVVRAGRNDMFLHLLAREALAFSPPAPLLLRLKGGSSIVDLKLHGLAPIVFLARCYALSIGSAERSTIARLDAAQRSGVLGEEMHATVVEAYRFLLSLRLRVQLRMMGMGAQVTNKVQLAELGPPDRSRLKEAFRAIKAWQAHAAFQHRVSDV